MNQKLLQELWRIRGNKYGMNLKKIYEYSRDVFENNHNLQKLEDDFGNARLMLIKV